MLHWHSCSCGSGRRQTLAPRWDQIKIREVYLKTTKDYTFKENPVEENTVEENPVEENPAEGNPAEDNAAETDNVVVNTAKENSLEEGINNMSLGASKFKCDRCGIEYKKEGFFNSHIRKKHQGSGPGNNCPECRKVCPTSSSLSSHKKCKKEFPNDYLVRHEKTCGQRGHCPQQIVKELWTI